MSPALCARMPRLGPAASCSPSLARLPLDVLTASPVRLSMAPRCTWSNPAMSLPSQARCLCPRGVLPVQAGRCHVADKQGCWDVLWPPSAAAPLGEAAGPRAARPRFIPKKL